MNLVRKEKIINLCSRISRYGIYGLAFFIPIYFAWFQENYSVFDLNKSVALHLILSVIIVAWLIEVTLSREFSWGSNRILALMHISLAAVFLVSTIFSISQLTSLFGSYERLQGLYNLWSYIGVAFFVILTIKNNLFLERLIISLLLGSSIVCLYGLMQAFGLDFLTWGESGVHRIFSSFGQPNFLAHYLITILPFSLYAIFFLSKNIYIRVLYIVLAAVNITCIIFTLSRGAWVSLFVTSFFLIIWILLRKGKKLWTGILISIIIIGASLLIQTNIADHFTKKFSNYNTNVVDRLVSIINLNIIGSNTSRFLYWHAAYQIFADSSLPRKLFGYGPDTQPFVFVKYYQPNWAYYERINSFPDRAHNFIFDITLQFGIVGFLAFSFFSGYIVWKLARYAWYQQDSKKYWLGMSFMFALTAYGINNFFSFSLVGMNVILYLLLAGAWLVANQFKNKEIRIKFFHSLSLFILLVTISVFLFILIYIYNVKPLIADYYYFEVKKAEARGNCRSSLDNMEKVLEWYSLSDYYGRAYLHQGTNCFIAVNDSQSQWQLGDNLLEQISVMPRNKWNYLTTLNLAQVYSMLGYYLDKKYFIEAESYYKELIEISPNITTNYQDYGRMKAWEGKYSDAINIYKKGIEVSPLIDPPPPGYADDIYYQVSYFYNLLGQAYMGEKNFSEALLAFHKAIKIKSNIASYYKDIADAYYKNNDIRKAIYYNKKGAELEANKSEWPYFIGLLYNEQEDKKRALEYANKALTLEPTNQKIIDFIDELKKNK